ncbi:MAG: dolichol-phosphate mannosyltransferase [Deltaproteobacteria bacterium CG11_big_fil_rev_8_21_14_0_20_45_16]|nr:MAG: dolichol-phosphate mannosyltransferase [Deltaproteobacteria bacterium CG11_big_fil_rev_8_21_14_0_20_45_16]
MKRVFVLLPAFNEEESLPQMLPKIADTFKNQAVEYKILIANDGSSDRTLELSQSYAATYPIEILNHKINRGLGETERDLFERAAEIADGDDYIVRFDCDDTHEPKFILDMVARIDVGFDVVIASRFQAGGGQMGVPAYRALMSRLANLFMKLFFPISGVREYSCGYRAYRASLIKRAIKFYGNNFIQLKGLGFTGTLETIVKLKILNAKFSEVPFLLRYDQKLSASKMVSSITTFGYMVMVVLYHWPWGGWRRGYRKQLSESSKSRNLHRVAA